MAFHEEPNDDSKCKESAKKHNIRKHKDKVIDEDKN